MKVTSQVFREAALIFLAASCLGVAYNAANPLGVRVTAGPALTTGDGATGSRSQMATQPDAALRNETINATLFASAAGAPPPPVEKQLLATLPWPEVKSLLAQGQIDLVDARDTHSFETGHIPGAVSLPLNQLKEKIGEFATRYPKTKPLVIYCSNILCGMAHVEAIQLTEQHGYEDVREMPGGYAEWMVAESKSGIAGGGR